MGLYKIIYDYSIHDYNSIYLCIYVYMWLIVIYRFESGSYIFQNRDVYSDRLKEYFSLPDTRVRKLPSASHSEKTPQDRILIQNIYKNSQNTPLNILSCQFRACLCRKLWNYWWFFEATGCYCEMMLNKFCFGIANNSESNMFQYGNTPLNILSCQFRACLCRKLLMIFEATGR